ncbi:4Fe-4S dicluster domain-containing protein [Chloroflexota bacterium]
MEDRLRAEAKALLTDKKVDSLIGYAEGSLKFVTTPLITTKPKDAEKLVINPFIMNNLSVFLKGRTGKTAVCAKPCDARSIVSLIQDNQIKREDVFIIGMPCQGLIDFQKVEAASGYDRDELDSIKRDGDTVTISVGGKEQTLPMAQVSYDDCLRCESTTHSEYDVVIKSDEGASPAGENPVRENYEQLSPTERWAFWKDEFTRCIRCYACRQVCPACFCERCFAQETEPRWINNAPHWQDNAMFQIIRVLHTTGRCTDCGECERACPVGIPLRLLTSKMYETAEELFDYKIGEDKDALPLMAAYQTDEVDDLIR